MLQGDTGGLNEREHAIVQYTNRLTREPNRITAADVDTLRAVGLDDRSIHDLVQVAAYFAFANRFVSGLGVEMLPDEPIGAWPSEDA